MLIAPCPLLSAKSSHCKVKEPSAFFERSTDLEAVQPWTERKAINGQKTINKKQGQQRMKKFIHSLSSNRLVQKFGTYLAATSTVAMVAVASSGALTRAKAESHEDHGASIEGLHARAQIAELDQLLAEFHGALSYGGDLAGMMSLWADDSSLTLNGVAHVGKDAVQTFFATGAPFHNNWVSLAPEYKTQITVRGHTADFTTQCVFIDLTVTPMVVKSVVQVTGTAVKREGVWIFSSMNNTAPAPL
jgi:hypothetical protein